MAYTNKEDQKQSSRRHYLLNRQRIIDRAKIHKRISIKKCQQYILEHLTKHPCIDCGITNPVVLEFDHRPDVEKKFNISDFRNHNVALPTLIQEIEKCDVRCANCHRIITYVRGGRTNKNIVLTF